MKVRNTNRDTIQDLVSSPKRRRRPARRTCNPGEASLILFLTVNPVPANDRRWNKFLRALVWSQACCTMG